MKKFTFKGVLDGFRSSVQATPRGTEQEIQEILRPEHFQVKKTFRHGFPFSPTALAFDPIQKLLAIGDKAGNLRILGGPGVDAHVRHESGEAVVLARFLTNEGALVTATADDQLHLWNFRQKSPQVVQSLKFQRERITCLHLPLQSRWLHVGTERGNVHVVHIETFVLSGYVINWNKAIEVTRSSHPGAVVDISDNPLDANKLLIAFENGPVVVWDLRARSADWRGCLGGGGGGGGGAGAAGAAVGAGEGVRAAAWQHDGKLMTAHVDGALATWTMRAPRPISLIYPHAKANKDGKLEACKPIHRLEWKTSRNGESLVIFSGGLPTDKAGRTHSITVLNGKSTTVLEMEHSVVDFVTLCESPWTADYQEPYAVVVLLQKDLVVIDLLSPGYPCFENPYPMDLHESPVTCCSYFADCPSDLIPAFYSVGRAGNKRQTGFSERPWPVDGGEWTPASCSYSEIILTGHADGSVKFWDASAGTLQILYKLKCSKVFERRAGSWTGSEEDSPLAVQLVTLCAESRRLCVALPAGHVLLFKFRKTETGSETHVLDIPVISESMEEPVSPDSEFGSRATGPADERRCGTTGCELRVRGAQGTGGVRKAAGFQAALVCLQQGSPHPAAALTINSSYGLMAWGGERGLVIVDVSRRSLVATLPATALYGSEPWGRAPRPAPSDRQRSPSLDQLEEASSRHSPLASASPAEGIACSLPDALPADERARLDTRRKSTSWKGFNLKRQLSKVDLKLKAAFVTAAPDELEGDDDNAAPARPDPFERMHRELHERSACVVTGAGPGSAESAPAPSPAPTPTPVSEPDDVYERIHRELQERWQERERDESGEPPPRPDNLPLFEEECRPVRPPRHRPTTRADDRRDQRLLSVPNIKYNKSNPATAAHEVARKRSAGGSAFAGAVSAAAAAAGSGSGAGGSFAGNFMRRFNKLDSSFSRSRSSSMSSLENISQEAIQCLAFADSYTKKSEPTALSPTLWVGTSLGSVFAVPLSVPDPELRHTHPAAISTPGGPMFRLKGSILSMSFLDCNGALIPYTCETWKDDNRDARDGARDRRERTPTKQSSGSGSRMSPTPTGAGPGPGASAPAEGDRQFVVVASEKQARVVALPSHNCVYRQQIVEGDFVVKAEIVSLKDSVCLVNYLSTGHLVAYSLPSLRPLIDVDFLPLSELRIARTFCFSNRGHGLYLASPTEIQKFTIDTEFCYQLNEMLGELFLPREMPEPPKESFFRGLFGGGARPLDREELFGEGSGRPNRTVAKHIPGPTANLESLGQRASTAAGEVSRAHQLVVERGDKLSQLEDRTERMHMQAAEFSSSAHQLMLKYKDKKWYQL